MPGYVQVDVTPVAPLLKALRSLPGSLDRDLHDDAMLAAAKVVVRRAKRIVPKGKTGNLEMSIRAQRAPARYKPGAMAIASGTARKGLKGYHAHLLEFGTVKMPAQPFLGPAARLTTGGQLDAAVRVIRSGFDRVISQLEGRTRAARRVRRGLARDVFAPPRL